LLQGRRASDGLLLCAERATVREKAGDFGLGAIDAREIGDLDSWALRRFYGSNP
jgi:hypothetical protein